MFLAPSPAAAAADVLLAALLLLLRRQQPCASSLAVALAALAAAAAAADALRPSLRLQVLQQAIPSLLLLLLCLTQVQAAAGHLFAPRQGCTAMWLLAAALLVQANTLDACTAAHAH
jgi:hypothetical protein